MSRAEKAVENVNGDSEHVPLVVGGVRNVRHRTRLFVLLILIAVGLLARALMAASFVFENITFGSSSGTILVIIYINMFLDHGLGVVCFIILALTSDAIATSRKFVQQLYQHLRRVMYRVDSEQPRVSPPDPSTFPVEYKRIAQALVAEGLVKDRRWRLFRYASCFIGLVSSVALTLARVRSCGLACIQRIYLYPSCCSWDRAFNDGYWDSVPCPWRTSLSRRLFLLFLACT